MAQGKAGKALRKITTKTVGFTLDAVREALGKNKETRLYSVIGVVTGARPGVTDKGEFLTLMGDFKATNLVTGEVFVSGKAILPGFVGDPIGMAALKPNADGVQFALTIGAEVDAKSVAGFQYTAESLLPPSPHSPLAQLEQTLADQKLLPAPKK